jgi:oxaloacetate decarboxylase alpha subunit
MLRGTQYDPGLNLDRLNAAAEKIKLVRDKYFASGVLNPKALMVNPLILQYQLPGGMLSNLMSQLENQGAIGRYEEVLREVPAVRADLGYPPLVTPLSQMVGTQAVMNVLTGERYKLVPEEIKDYLRGHYGASPGPIDEDFRKSIIGADKVIDYRPADDLKPQFENLKRKYQDLARTDEDVLSIALFENVAVNFLENKYLPRKEKEIHEINLHIG